MNLGPLLPLLLLVALLIFRNFSIKHVIKCRCWFYQDIRWNHLRSALMKYLKKCRTIFTLSPTESCSDNLFWYQQSTKFEEICSETPPTRSQKNKIFFYNISWINRFNPDQQEQGESRTRFFGREARRFFFCCCCCWKRDILLDYRLKPNQLEDAPAYKSLENFPRVVGKKNPVRSSIIVGITRFHFVPPFVRYPLWRELM